MDLQGLLVPPIPNAVVDENDAQFLLLTPKLRKPYTITKQRQKWTGEEHHKFLDALKLYGRAWRQIEEFVGTKTAVQIRSHAQKYFSKVERGGNDRYESLVEAIEIPPPRPKRKPTHPYPRKLVDSQSNIDSPEFHQEKRMCPRAITTDYEINQSPNSFVAMPHMLKMPSSESPNSCLSSSSGSGDLQGSLLSVNNEEDFKSFRSIKYNGKTVTTETNRSTSSVVDMSSDVSIKSSEEEADLPEASIILFGQIVSIKNSQRPSSRSKDTLMKNGMQLDRSMMKNDFTEDIPSAVNFMHSSILVVDTSITTPKRTYRSGFVPYQRCFAAGNIKSANTLTEEDAGQRVRLCL